MFGKKESHFESFILVDVNHSSSAHRFRSYLILLFKPVTLPTLHLGDVLEQVCHSDGRLELARLVGHLHRLTASIWVRLDGHRGLGHLTVAAICGGTIQNP